MGEESLWTLPPFPEVKHVVPGAEISERKQLLVWGVISLEKPTHGPVEELTPWWDEIVDDEGLSDKPGSHCSVTVRSKSDDWVTLAVYNVGAKDTLNAAEFVKLGAFAATQAKQHKKVTEVSARRTPAPSPTARPTRPMTVCGTERVGGRGRRRPRR